MNSIKCILLDIDGCITEGKNRKMDLKLMLQLQKNIRQSLPIRTTLCTGRSASYVESICQMLHISDWCICENGSYLYHPISDEIIINPLIEEKSINQLHEIKDFIKNNHFIKDKVKFEIGKEICISLNPVNDLSIEELFKIIQKYSHSTEDIFLSHSTTAVDITPKGINKGSILDIWCQLMKLNLNQILGVGDSAGDIYFLEKCAMVACPSNAMEYAE